MIKYKLFKLKRKIRELLFKYLPLKWFEKYKEFTLKKGEYGISIDVTEFNDEFKNLLKEDSLLYIPCGMEACIRQASFDYGRMKRMAWYFNSNQEYDRGDTVEIYIVGLLI